MIEWSDRGIVLAARPHGEDGVIVSLLSAGHGRHSGIVRGGRGKRLRAALQPGSLVQATWKARLEDHLGSLVVELLAGVAGGLLDDRDRLAALAAACALAETVLPERAPQADVYDATLALLDALAEGGEGTPLVWAGAFVRWEIGLLAALGFGLDLS
ncbi:DNA repair protein RecO, partial [Rhodospirillum rubrum]